MKKILYDISRLLLALFIASALSTGFSACGGEENEPVAGQTPGAGDEGDNTDTPPEGTPLPPDADTFFAKGADVSWLTLQEAGGEKFYDAAGNPADAMRVLRDECGVNAVRLRVWVNPADGYCSPSETLAKALRAKALGLPVMIDFHLSDSWADPGKQTPPAAWAGLPPQLMADAVRSHVAETLYAMALEGVDVRWVQIGNETASGMLWEAGRVQGSSAGSFPLFLNAGYDAAKSVYPDAQVIVHLDRGQDAALYSWFFPLIAGQGAKFDIIGMSLYPEKGTWPEQTDNDAVDSCIANMNSLYSIFHKPVMLCEIGFHYTRGAEAARVIRKIMTSYAPLKGIFYWEPQASPGFNGGYNKGAFVGGRPNGALAPFTDSEIKVTI